MRLRIFPTDEDSIGCSGTLISPVWVVTAAHCFDTPGRRQAQVDVQGGLAGDVLLSRHTLSVSGMVSVNDPSCRGTDLALVRLDWPVTPTLVDTAHPPLQAGACGSGQTMTLAGYSKAGYDDWPYDGTEYGSCFGFLELRRRTSTSPHWFREPDGDGAVFVHEYSGPAGQLCQWFSGGNNGDSGGSLYLTNSNTLCGVISGNDFWDFSRSADLQTHYVDYNTAALDDAHNAAFWQARVLDEDGFFEAECGLITPSTDPDGDGIHSLCDSCPLIYNPEQFGGPINGDDLDQDGIDAACDLCPTVATTAAEQQQNRNAENELAVAYPTLDHAQAMLPLRLVDFAGPVELAAAAQQYRNAFPANACDPHPVPQQELNAGGSLPVAPSYPVDTQQCVLYPGGCETVVQNKIKLKWDNTTTAAAATGTVGLRWCDCGVFSSDDLGSVEGRAKCRRTFAQNCVFNELRYTESSSLWRKIRTSDTFSWSGTGTLGKEWSLSNGTPTRDVYFNFPDLGASISQTNGTRVNGISWAHTRTLSPSIPALPDSSVQRYSNSLGDGRASHSIRPKGSVWSFADEWFFCGQDCVDAFGRLYFEVSNPEWKLSYQEGLRPTQIAAPVRTLFDTVAGGSARYVSSSEPLLTQSAWFGKDALLRGVALSNTHQLTHLVTSNAEHRDLLVNTASISGAPTLDGREAVVVSGGERAVYLFGGGSPDRIQRLKLDSLSPATGTWSVIALPAGETIGTGVLAAIYRPRDRAIYFVERIAGAVVLKRLHVMRRAPEGGKLQTLATFPAGSSWAAFTSFALALGENGDLALVARGTASEKTRIGRFALNASSQLSLTGVQKLTTKTEGRPLLLPQALLIAYAGADRSKTLRYPLASMPAPVSGDQPTWSVH